MSADTTNKTRVITDSDLESALESIRRDRSNDVSKVPTGQNGFYVEISRGSPVVIMRGSLREGGARHAIIYSDHQAVYSSDPNYRHLRALLEEESAGFQVTQGRHSHEM